MNAANDADGAVADTTRWYDPSDKLCAN